MGKFKELVNDAYYNSDEPILSDNEFDLIDDVGLEIKNFHKKAKHLQPMGSLKKIKTEDDFYKWVKGSFTITPKLDGNSLEVIFHNGEFVQAITRGDGILGNDVTDKVEHCNLLFPFPHIEGYVSVKCEAIMDKKYQKDYEKNIRNVVSGVINKKGVDVKELKKIDVLSFDDLPTLKSDNDYNRLSELYENIKENYRYEIDGLVVELDEPYYGEDNPLLPSNKVALKFNKEGVEGIVGNINWNLGKYGRLTPVIILKEPVTIDGTNVQMISASNYGLLKEAGIGINSIVKVIKAGEIIPYISEVVETSPYLAHPICPQCGDEGEISDNGIHATCLNCKEDGLVHLKHIFSVFNIDYIGDSLIDKIYNEGYTNIIHLANVTPEQLCEIEGIGKTTAEYFINQLKNITLTESQVLQCAMIKGISLKQSERLINHYGDLDNFFNYVYSLTSDDIDGIGEVLVNSIYGNIDKFKNTYKELLTLGVNIVKEEKTLVTGKNIAMTGTCDKLNRKDVITHINRNGDNYHDGIKKDTNILLTDDINSESSKMKKAKKLGIKIVSYNDYLN